MALEIRPTYFISGDFDSRKRFLRKGSGNLYLCSGVTWEVGGHDWASNGSDQFDADIGWKWRISGVASESFNLSAGTAAATPSNTVTRMDF